MPKLVPNRPIDRLRYVVDTYMGTKNQAILEDVVKIAFMLLGLDQYATRFARQPWTLRSDYPHGDDILGKIVPQNHPHDFLIPWVAKEVGRLRKAVLKDQATGDDYANAVGELEKKGPAIAMWALENRVDLMKTSLADALEAVKDFEIETGEDVPQGSVVYEFDDGYTIQRLTKEAELEAEGEIMQHCVGGYCKEVASGATVIFSLRDKNGRPHATIEWVPENGKTGLANTLLRWRSGEPALPGKFIQIRGKQNEKPAAKYVPYLQQFIVDRFESDPLGLLLVATPGQKIVFAGHEIEEIDFADSYADVDLHQADFRNATFIGAVFDSFSDMNFDGAIFSACQFGYMERCSFRGARFGGLRERELSNAINGQVKQCSFHGATFDRGAHISHGDVIECDFRSTTWRGEAGAYDLLFIECDLSKARWDGADFNRVAFRSCGMDGLTIESASLSSIVLVDVDLRGMDVPSATLLFEHLTEDDFGRSAHEVKWPRGLEEQVVLAGRATRERFVSMYGEDDEEDDSGPHSHSYDE